MSNDTTPAVEQALVDIASALDRGDVATELMALTQAVGDAVAALERSRQPDIAAALREAMRANADALATVMGALRALRIQSSVNVLPAPVHVQHVGAPPVRFVDVVDYHPNGLIKRIELVRESSPPRIA